MKKPKPKKPKPTRVKPLNSVFIGDEKQNLTVEEMHRITDNSDAVLVVSGIGAAGMLSVAAMDVLMQMDERNNNEICIYGLPRSTLDFSEELKIYSCFKGEDPGAKARRLFDPPPKSARKR